MRFERKITIISVRRPQEHSLNKGLQYLGSALGLFGLRDKDKSCYRVFLELLKAAKMQVGLSSDELADRLQLTRGTVVHHLNKLMESGLVVHVRNRYYLREQNLSVVLEEVRKDIDRSLDELMNVANEIDALMELE